MGLLDSKPQNKDKSAWRKSNLNVSNSTEDAEERRLRRQRSREGSNGGGALHSIDEEENKRKNIIQSLGDRAATDKLSIYLRRPSDNENKSPVRSPTTNINQTPLDSSNKQSIYIKQSGGSSSTPPAEKHSIYIRQNRESPSTISSIQLSPDSEKGSSKTSNKAEIDSDNIETPPTTRRMLNTTCRRLENPRPLHPETLELDSKKNLINPAEQEVLGDGQFDRFSAARRTRRFKRPTDYSSGTEERTSSTTPESPPKDTLDTSNKSSTENKNDRLKQWQHKLKSLDAELEKDSKKASNSDTISNRIKTTGGRNITKISQEDVRDAIRSLKSPTPERTWDAPKDFKINGPVTVATKIITHELNDEGFEETQSLVSDTPSSCNDTTDTKTVRRKPERLASTDSAATSASDVSRNRRSTSSSKPSTNTLQSLLVKNQQSLEKSRSLRGAPPSKLSQLQTKRATSMRVKAGGEGTSNRRLDVERSSSRASLRSSRSSINSAVSTNTVKKVPLKSSTPPNPVASSSHKRPLSTQNSSINKTTNRTPASRSSSSGSSIGPNRKTPVKNTTSGASHTTSFKENQRESSISRPVRTPAAKSSVSSKATLDSNANTSNSHNNISRNARQTSSGYSRPSSSSSFMRPTAASATKVKGK